MKEGQANHDNHPVTNVAAIAARDLDRLNLDLIHSEALAHVTMVRLHPFLIEIGSPLLESDMKALSQALRPWARAWCVGEVRGKSLASAIRQHVQHAKTISLPIVGKQKLDRFLKWAKYCWPIGGAFAGDAHWEPILHGLVYFSKTYTKLPRELYANRVLRIRVEDMYLSFQESKTRFRKRITRHIRSAGPMSEWERFLAYECNMREKVTKAWRITQVYDHQAFCRFWKALNEQLSPSEFAVLKRWTVGEAGSYYQQTEQLDFVNCRCLSPYEE